MDAWLALAGDADPTQVAFSPDGSVVVIYRASTDSIVTSEFTPDGTFGASRAVESQGPTPYGFAFTSGGTLVVTEDIRAEKGRSSGIVVPDRRWLARAGLVVDEERMAANLAAAAGIEAEQQAMAGLVGGEPRKEYLGATELIIDRVLARAGRRPGVV